MSQWTIYVAMETYFVGVVMRRLKFLVLKLLTSKRIIPSGMDTDRQQRQPALKLAVFLIFVSLMCSSEIQTVRDSRYLIVNRPIAFHYASTVLNGLAHVSR